MKWSSMLTSQSGLTGESVHVCLLTLDQMCVIPDNDYRIVTADLQGESIYLGECMVDTDRKTATIKCALQIKIPHIVCLHEIGYLLMHLTDELVGGFDTSPEMRKWVRAIRDSLSFHRISSRFKTRHNPVTGQMLSYNELWLASELNKFEEYWARCFTQYIAQTTKNGEIRREFGLEANANYSKELDLYLSEYDLVPVFDAYHKLLESAGFKFHPGA